jgi:hypothetical protein
MCAILCESEDADIFIGVSLNYRNSNTSIIGYFGYGALNIASFERRPHSAVHVAGGVSAKTLSKQLAK